MVKKQSHMYTLFDKLCLSWLIRARYEYGLSSSCQSFANLANFEKKKPYGVRSEKYVDRGFQNFLGLG